MAYPGTLGRSTFVSYIKDAERLDQDGSKVFNAIKYLRDVVTKGVLEQLSGATNIVLESVAEILQSVSKYFINQESTLLTSMSSQVYQSLANLIQWADHRMLDRSQMDHKCIHEYIDPLEKGIKELLQLSKEKLQSREISGSKTVPRLPGHRKASGSDSRTAATPDPVPLTANELKLLDQGHVLLSASHSNGGDAINTAPPKPPLPHKYKINGPNGTPRSCSEDDVFSIDAVSPDNEAPPLPVKLKSRTHSSYDNSDEPDAMGASCGENEIKGTGTNISPPQQTTMPNICVVSPQRSTQDPQITAVTTPRSQSPTSSISSAKSGSSVDYLFDKSGLTASHLEAGNTEQRLSHYDNHQHLQHAHVWSQSINCDSKNTTDASSTIHRTSREQISHSKQSISVHTSSCDSGIYDNKSSSGFYDNKASLTLASGEKCPPPSADTNDGLPPPLPDKKNKKPDASYVTLSPSLQRARIPSMYDNMTEESTTTAARLCTMATSASMATKTQTIPSTNASGPAVQRQFIKNVTNTEAAAAMRTKRTMNVVASGRQIITSSATVSQTMQMRYMKETFTPDTADQGEELADGDPPPLPPKKRHVETYMQIFGQSSGMPDQDLTRRSVRSMHFYHEQWQQHQMEVFLPNYRRSNTFSVQASRDGSQRPELYSLISGSSVSSIDTPRSSDALSVISTTSSEDSPCIKEFIRPAHPIGDILPELPSIGAPDLPVKQRSSNTSSSSGVSSRRSDPTMTSSTQSETTEEEDIPRIKEIPPKKSSDSEKRLSAPTCSPESNDVIQKADGNDDKPSQKERDSAYAELMENSVLDEVDVAKHIVRKKATDDGPDLRGGSIDALIVHATTTGKHDFMYQEAFLTTYRTMITSHELVEKLLYRYNRFSRMNDIKLKKLSRNAFSLLTRVVNELCTEVDEKLIEMLMNLVFQMLCDGELTLARVLRSKVLEKCLYLQKLRESHQQAALWPQHKLLTKQFSVFNFKSQDIAEQMTLLDAELFQKIEIPEVLLWAREQVEEQSPNLTHFTEHFNKMSYWCRTRIMEQEDPKDREHCFVKFIKIMRYLEKFNNFNSYLAVLSALSSSPLARLEWQKQNAETLAQYFLLIDNTHGFRTYRQRLSETEPPCIPYIGLVLQDLTFVHVGNKDWLSDDVVNFVKRWQQFNILDNMRRFRKCNYEFTKKEKIVQFFNYFDNYLPEETLWQISEAIKPPKRTLYKN